MHMFVDLFLQEVCFLFLILSNFEGVLQTIMELKYLWLCAILCGLYEVGFFADEGIGLLVTRDNTAHLHLHSWGYNFLVALASFIRSPQLSSGLDFIKHKVLALEFPYNHSITIAQNKTSWHPNFFST